MAFMKFYVGTEASVQEHLDGIYLATDTHKIFYNGSAYGGGDVDLSNYATKDDLDGYLPLSGGTLTGNLYIQSDEDAVSFNGITFRKSNFNRDIKVEPLPLVGGYEGGTDELFVHSGNQFYLTLGSDGSEAGTGNQYGLRFQGNIGDIIWGRYGSGGSRISAYGFSIAGKSNTDLLHAAGGTISIDELKSQLNIPDTSSLQSAIGTNTYTGANYVSKETNLTEAVLQLDEEIKATNDNLALEHTNAEATYAKKSELDDYLPLAGGKIANSPLSDDYIQITPRGSGSAATPYIYISGQATTNEDDKFYIGIGRRFPGQLSSSGARIWAETNFSQMIINPKTGSITAFRKGTVEGVKETQYRYNGVYMVGKTPNDLLHANGGTVSIQDIISQVTVPTKVSDLTNDSGFQTEAQVSAKVSALVNSAPATLDTLKELADALDNDPNFATTISTELGKKLNTSTYNTDKATFALKSDIPSLDGYAKFSDLVSIYLSKTEASETYQPKGNYLTSVSWSQVSGKPSWIGSSKPSYTWSEIGSKPTFATVATSGSYNDLTNKPTIPSLTGYATQSWVNSQGFAKGSFLPLTGGTLSGDLIRSNSGDVKRAKINNLEISVYDSINTTCKAIMSCTSNYGVLEVGNNLNNKNVHIDANTGITLKGTGVGISLSTGGSSSKFFATDGSVQTINVDNFALKSTTDALTAITENQDKRIRNMKLGMARYTSGTTAQVIKGNEGTVGLSGTPALYFYNGGIITDTVPISNCIRVKDAQCHVDNKGIYFTFPVVSTVNNGLMTSQDKQYLNWVVNSQFGTTIGMDEPNLTNLAKISSAANYVKTHLSTFITNNTSADLDVIQVLQGFIVGDNVHLKLAISIQDTESQVYTVKPQSNNNIVATAISSNNDYRAIVDLWFIVNNLSFAMDRKYVLDY